VSKDGHLIRGDAASRARAGLWLGPGLIACMVLVQLGLLAFDVDPEHSTAGRLTVLGIMLVIFFGHLFSFFEMLVSLPGLSESPRPKPVILLSVYWALIPVVILLLGLLGRLTR